MDRTGQERIITPGMDVLDRDGHKLGTVEAVRGDELTLRKGTFFPREYVVPLSAVARRDADRVTLTLTGDEVTSGSWDRTEQTRERVDEDGNIVVPVVEEELVATPRQVVRGKVRIRTQIFDREEMIDVPVTEERVRIERRVHDPAAAGEGLTVDGGTFEVPFYGEDIDVETRVRVIEEIVITREAVESVRRVRGTVRREEVRVEEQDAIEPGDEGTASPPAP